MLPVLLNIATACLAAEAVLPGGPGENLKAGEQRDAEQHPQEQQSKAQHSNVDSVLKPRNLKIHFSSQLRRSQPLQFLGLMKHVTGSCTLSSLHSPTAASGKSKLDC